MDSISSESDMNDSSRTSSSESNSISSDVGEGGGTKKGRRHVKGLTTCKGSVEKCIS